MRITTLVSAIVLALGSAFANASELPQEREVNISINEAFIPGGFDSESDVYVVASGLFPNSCYRWKEANVSHDKQMNVHEVRATAGVSQGMCLMVLVPFTKEIQLGKLGAGEHKIRFMNGDGTYMEKVITLE